MLLKFTKAVKLLEAGSLFKVSWGKWWIVDRAFIRYFNYEKQFIAESIVVPKWYKTDFGSIPRYMQRLLSPTKRVAYILHDFMYTSLRQYIDNETLYDHYRKIADDVMYDALIVEGMPEPLADVVYLWVRKFWKIRQRSQRKKQGII